MFTAKIIDKQKEGAALRVYVEFSDGVTTVTESCIPQDEDGFKFWVKSRLATFNGAQTIDATYATDADVDVSEPVVVPPTLTQAEIDRNEWLMNYAKWIKVKTTLVDTGIVLITQPQVAALKAKVSAGLKAEYLDFI